MKALVVGHFSTFGDLVCLDIIETLLRVRDIPGDVYALNADARTQVGNIKDQRLLNPLEYSYLILCCGPYWKDLFDSKGFFLSDYSHCKRVAFNTTMVDPVTAWSPFHLLFERDSDRANRVEFAFMHDVRSRPLISTCFIDAQSEYGDAQLHSDVISNAKRFLAEWNEYVVIPIDTRFPPYNNTAGLEHVDQFTSVVSSTEVLVTNRLHGAVFGLLSGTPVIAIDCVRGGDKVTAQCERIGWPGLINGADLAGC